MTLPRFASVSQETFDIFLRFIRFFSIYSIFSVRFFSVRSPRPHGVPLSPADLSHGQAFSHL